MRTAIEEARIIARAARQQGYPDAEAAEMYCIDGDVGPDKFWTRTVSVYLGDRRGPSPKTSIFHRIKAAIFPTP